MNEEPEQGAAVAQERPTRSRGARGRDAASERALASAIAIDMEQGRWTDPDTGERWPEGKPLSKTAVARAMGYSVANGKTLAFMREPEWTRALEYERIRRNGDIGPMLSATTKAMAAEIMRRVMIEPESIPDRVLLPEFRQLVELQAGLARPSAKFSLEEYLRDFAANLRLLPPKSREAAVRSMQNDAERYMAATRALDTVLEPPKVLGPGKAA